MTKKTIIQEEICVDQEFIDETIADYEKMDKKYHMGVGDFMGIVMTLFERLENFQMLEKGYY